MSQGGRRGSLIDAVDRCVTGAGARQLAEDLSAPLTGRDAIGERLELVQWLHDRQPAARGRCVLRCARCPISAGRWAGSVAWAAGSPRDLGQLRDGLGEARRCCAIICRAADRPALLDRLLPALGGHGALTDL
jgi:DNA mismatch repair protein MutS